jgi:aldehyde dehydrogenase (NAD+)
METEHQTATSSEQSDFMPRRYSGFEGQFIGGKWLPGHSGRSFDDTDPYTGKTLASISLANAVDLDAAYAVAAAVQPIWSSTMPVERAMLMHRVAEVMEVRRGEILDWLVHESGSTRIKAEIEWRMLHGITLEAASFPHRAAGDVLPADVQGMDSRVYRHPVGVIGVISPWNFPIYLSERAVGPAIALGNTVVLKPAHDTAVTGGLLLAKIYEEAGLPAGVLNVVIGDSHDIGDQFVQHPVPRMISFTGSTKVGKHIAALAMTAPLLKKVTLELGGNSPFVVLDDADLDRAVRAAMYSRYLHQGQICMSANRIIVDVKLYARFVESFATYAGVLQHGNPSDPQTVVGPVINKEQLDNMLGLMEESRRAGAVEVLGGEPNGLVLPPHVFADVTNDMPIARNETFGPIATIIKAADEADALRIANDTEYGLSSAVYTGDETRGLRFALGMGAGMTHINDSTVEDQPNAPFGGEKNSGLGRYGGEWIMREMTTDHWITAQHEPRHYPF